MQVIEKSPSDSKRGMLERKKKGERGGGGCSVGCHLFLREGLGKDDAGGLLGIFEELVDVYSCVVVF